MIETCVNQVVEWSYTSSKMYQDPFNEVEVDVVFTDEGGRELCLPAFWGGGQNWRVRFAAPEAGVYQFHSVCSDAENSGLHGVQGVLKAADYQGEHALTVHGRLQMAADRRHLQHRDGTPFFWLADTWWMGFCKRLSFPDDFRELAADRVKKGFTVAQIVAGLYPDMEPFDERGANEAGFPWAKDFSTINPAYFDMADLRVAHMVRCGIVPCIVGSWGYFLAFAGKEVLKKHWRNLVARYGAYPVVWCTAGEALMDYYLDNQDEDRETRLERRRRDWSEIVRHIRSLDGYHNPVTIHPTNLGHDQVSEPELLDLDMLQTGHGGFTSLGPTIEDLTKSLAHEPKLPVLVSEVDYEGIMESSREEVQRFHFWSCMLSGAMGHTYGANGLWQLNTREKPYGKSPHGSSWGNLPWDEAYLLPGSYQLGLGKRLLESYRWWLFETHLEWVSSPNAPGDRIKMYAAGIPGEVRVIFIPAQECWIAWQGKMFVQQIEADVKYHVFYSDPKTGDTYDLGEISGVNEYQIAKPPIFQDWVLVLEASVS